MRVVFIGSSGFGLRCLDAARQIPNIEIAGIITNEARFRISYAPEGVMNVLHADMPSFARAHGIPYYTMQEKMSEPALLEQVAAWDPALFLVVGWYHLVPRVLRDMAPAVGMHASLLPDYSGGAPLVWAIINGETQTGISLFQLADGVDDGPLIGQSATPIHIDDTIATLYARIETLGLALLTEHLPHLAHGTAVFTPQHETGRRRFPNRSPADGMIDWHQPAGVLYNFIRAQTKPYPGAFTLYEGAPLHIWAARAESGEVPAAGTLFYPTPKKVAISCSHSSYLVLDTLGWHGTDMSASDWLTHMGINANTDIRFG